MKKHEWNQTKPMWVVGSIDDRGAIVAQASDAGFSPTHAGEYARGCRWRWNVCGQEFHATQYHDRMTDEEYMLVTEWLEKKGYKNEEPKP
jgi:hypothetical protein